MATGYRFHRFFQITIYIGGKKFTSQIMYPEDTITFWMAKIGALLNDPTCTYVFCSLRDTRKLIVGDRTIIHAH
jgi:hypothetical protein